VNTTLKRRLRAGRNGSTTIIWAALALALVEAFVAIAWAGAAASADEGQRALAWRAANLLHTPFDSSLNLTNEAGENVLSPACIFPPELMIEGQVCEAPSFQKPARGGPSPEVLASRRIVNLRAGETIDATAALQVSNGTISPPVPNGIRVQLQLVVSTSPRTATGNDVVATMTNKPSGEITGYLQEHHAPVLSRGSYTVLPTESGRTLYVDAVVTVSRPPGSHYGDGPCVDTPGNTITGAQGQAICPIENDPRESTLAVQRFPPAEATDPHMAVEAVEGPPHPQEAVFPGNGLGRDYPYTSVWESGPLRLPKGPCPATLHFCSVVEAHADLGFTVSRNACPTLVDGQFFLTHDAKIVQQSQEALLTDQEVNENSYSFSTRDKFPNYKEYEKSSIHLNSEAGKNIIALNTNGERGAQGALSVSASAKVPESGESWYVALAMAPTQEFCEGNVLTLDKADSHAEAILFRLQEPEEATWSHTTGTLLGEANATGLSDKPKPLITDSAIVKAGDIIDIGADAPVRYSYASQSGNQPLVKLTPCLALNVAGLGPIGTTCTGEDLSFLQQSSDVFRSARLVVPAGVRPGTQAMISYTMEAEATAESGSAPAEAGYEPGNLDVEIFEPECPRGNKHRLRDACGRSREHASIRLGAGA
jgi:hypothetical protein